MYVCTYIINKKQSIININSQNCRKNGGFYQAIFFLKNFAKPFLNFILASDSKSFL